VTSGAIQIGAPLAAYPGSPALASGSVVTGGSGSSFTVSPAQTVTSQGILAGTNDIFQPTEFVAQLDVHGPNGGDNAELIVAMMRSGYAADQFLVIRPQGDVTPLYATDAVQAPFVNGEAQYEYRWMTEAHLEIDPIIVVGQQFADVVNVTLVEVDGREAG